jgi:iron complex transport system ATP-binding protein
VDAAPPYAVELERVTAGYASGDVVRDVSFGVRPGELCAVLGPNGAGKSTIARLVAGLLRPREGAIRVLGRGLAGLDRREIARAVAVVPQSTAAAAGFTVREVVMMGRAPHQGPWMRASRADHEATERALDTCELAPLATRRVEHLSGGELQRVAVARALAQDTPILVLDEAGAHLDVRHAVELYERVRAEVASRGLACLVVLHDLNLAAEYADRVALLQDGRLAAYGTIEEVMTYRKLKEAFGTELYVGVNELDGARYFLPVRPRSRPPGPRDL